MNLRPLGDRLVVRPLKAEEVTATGILIPDVAQEKPQRGTVLAAGERVGDEGRRTPLDVAEGDEVLYSKYGGTEVEVDGEKLLVLHEADVLAVVR